MAIIRCTCCQAELTAPQFHNGYPYGYTCIKKINPEQKQTKIKYISVDAFKVVQQAGTRFVICVKFDGKWVQFVCYGSTTSVEDRTSSTFMQDGILFVDENTLKSKQLPQHDKAQKGLFFCLSFNIE